MAKKLIFFLILSLTLILMISGVSAGFFDFLQSSENTDNDLTVGFNSAFPPFGYEDADGNYTGFDIELAEEVCRRNNWTLKTQPIIDWNTKQMELESGEIDCIWSEFTINGREDDYTWSEPYFNNSKKIIVRSDSDIKNIDDLKDKVLEVQQGSSVLKTINNNTTLNNTFKEIKEVDGYDTALMDLQSGVCDVVIADSGLAYYLDVEKYHDTKILDENLSYENYGIGFKKGDTELRDKVQETLDEMYKDGTVDKIAQNYKEYKIPEGVIHPN